MDLVKKLVLGKVVLLLVYRGIVSSGIEGFGCIIEGVIVLSKSGK